MWTVQREDGSWPWLNCGWPPMEMDDHFGVTMAAIGVGAAPDGYAKSKEASQGIARIHKYLAEEPAPSAHHRGMVLWASLELDGILSAEKQKEVVSELLALQLPDGGWSTAALFGGWKAFKRKDSLPPALKSSDAYATGFVVYLARKAKTPADDARLVNAVAWLKKDQRESGRWFSASPTKDSQHLLSNYGTAFAVMALEACGQVPAKPRVANR